ncbi:hypothetical protein O181_054582 [Austropuccinia psidii MF-1]|uniref:CCHC-type domain-containing protein n=1 Tax=Austropuccinia psidii MF-1 TaxID=1389203 RepID=A0A9Q3E775_9BASI|nr:hypothetical protein [Austropuccinia psidii MF-1]
MLPSTKDDTNPLDLSSLKISNDDAVSQANCQAESLNRFSLVTKKIRPRLMLDRSNFNLWSCAMVETWGSCFFDDLDYLDISERNTNYRRNLVALSFICMSIDRTLFQSTTSQLYMPNARSTYQALKKRFRKASWSAIVQHASRVFMLSDQSSNLLQHSISIQASLDALQSQIGPLKAENITPIILFFLAPQFQDQITTIFDTRKARNPNLNITTTDILDIPNCLQSKFAPESSSPAQLMRMESSKQNNFSPKQKLNFQHRLNSPRPSMTAQSINQQSPDWKKKWLNSKNPCFYCGGTGHWAPNCPIKLKAEEARSLLWLVWE